MNTFTVTISGMDLQDVLERCREKEADDFECIVPVQRLYSTVKTFRHQSGSRSRFDKHHFQQFEDLVRYKAVYRKVDA